MEKMRFKISSALKDLIGKDLITNDNVAIFELVKNSYDAYATKVNITFENDKIIIADNGKGMTLDDVRNKWLFLGFSAKKDGTENQDIEKQESYRDKIKRHYAGAKGIGRFSCDRLGKYLKLSTKSATSNKLEEIWVDWTQFEKDQQTEFSEIQVEYNSSNNTFLFPEKKSTGTVLEISGLDKKNPWNRGRLLDLKRSLEKLINPLAETNDFSIEIICKGEVETDKTEKKNNKHDRYIVNGILKNSIASVFKLKTTQVDITLNNGEIITTIIDRGVDIYKIREANKDYHGLDNVKISLYYLNRSAKINFTKLMGVEPVNYGSIFLFRNGFRIMPFGAPGDDSWNLDYRAQQGNRRFLGTRDLFGRVDIISNNVDDLKEVSSRDGGLIETDVSKQLFSLFKITHRRLERYVSGVLWGEAFLRKDYFKNESEARNERDKLLETDKEKDDPNYIIQSSIGSKIDFIQLIKTLTKDKNVEVLYYNKDLANILADPQQSEDIKPQFITDLEKIASDLNDSDLLFNIDEAKRQIAELQKKNELAELKAKAEEQRRKDAEEKARLAEIAKEEAEKKRKEAIEKKRKAELQAREAELQRREEELKRKEAELQREEEEKKRRLAEEARAQAEKEREVEKNKNKYLSATRNITKEAEDVLHTIMISSNELSASAKNINRRLENIPQAFDIQEELDYIYFHIERINKLSKILTKADITILREHTKTDIPIYISEYLPNYKSSLQEITFHSSIIKPIIKKIALLDLSVILDNLINNSVKAEATKIHIDYSSEGNTIFVDFSDNGVGVDLKKFSATDIFEVGITNRRGGSGIGLSTIKETMKRSLKGDIIFKGNGLHYKTGATFRLIFR